MAKDIIDEFEEGRRTRQKARKSIYFHTGSTLLDVVVGGGLEYGVPAGRILNLIGESGSGKTFFACELIAKSHRQYKDKFKWVYDDCENGFSFDGQKMWGLDIIPEEGAVQSKTIEELHYNVVEFCESLKKDECGIYVVDSLDSLMNETTKAEIEEQFAATAKGKEYDKGSYNMFMQKYLSQKFFRHITPILNTCNVLLVFVSQVRDNVGAGPYGKKDKQSGGRSLKFYCDTALWFTQTELFGEKDRPTGFCVKAHLDKKKGDRPFRSAYVNVLFDYGIDDESTNVDYVYGLKSPQTGKMLGAGTLNSINVGESNGPEYGKYPSTWDGIKKFMEDMDWWEKCRSVCKARGVKRVNKEECLNWITEDPERTETYEKYFGRVMSRDEIIDKAVHDKAFRIALKRRVLDKWNEEEEAVSSHREAKYSSDDDDEEIY